MSPKNATIHSAILIFSLLLFGCALTVEPASFQETPQAVRRGSILGPFQGTVRDAATGYAVKNARVAFIWNVSRDGRQTPVVRSTRTDINGRYYMPVLRFNPGFVPRMPFCGDSVCRERINDVQMIVEHPDYLPHVTSLAAFVPMRTLSSGDAPQPPQAGTEFYQLDNVVRLSKLTMEPPLPRKAFLFLAGMSNFGADEIYYRASAELTDESEWILDASGLLSAQDVREELDRDELPRMHAAATPDSFSGMFVFGIDGTQVGIHVLRGPVSLLARWVRSGTASPGRPANDLNAEIWKITAPGSGGNRIAHVLALLPDDGLLFSASCPETACRAESLEKLVRLMAARKRSVRMRQKETRSSVEIYRAVSGENPLLADRAEWFQVFTDARLHKWIQSIYSMPLGIYEPLDIAHADRLQRDLGELPATLAVLADSKKRVRILGLLVNGALHRAMELQSAHPPAGPSQEDVLKLLRAAAMEPRSLVRQQLAAYAFFTLGRHLVPDAPAPGLRTRMQSFLDVLRHGRPDAAGDRGWMVFEPLGGQRFLVADPLQLRDFPRGRLLLLFSSGKTQSLPWPPAPDAIAEYPQILQSLK